MADFSSYSNGLMFYNEGTIICRESMAQNLVLSMLAVLGRLNPAFRLMRIESPIMTPSEFVNAEYERDYMYDTKDNLIMRPETTMGAYFIARELLNPHNETKIRLPICVWQYGKSFRREQDKTNTKLRFKEFYQLEFQCLFAESTKNDYYPHIITGIQHTINRYIECKTELSDRLPNYSKETTDIICQKTGIELASISRRTDFLPDGLNIEVSIGMDRLAILFLGK